MPEVDLSPEGRRKCAGCERRDTGTRWAVRWTEEGYCSARCRDEHTKARRLEALERVEQAARAVISCTYGEKAVRLFGSVAIAVRDLEAALRSLDAGHPPAGEEPK